MARSRSTVLRSPGPLRVSETAAEKQKSGLFEGPLHAKVFANLLIFKDLFWWCKMVRIQTNLSHRLVL